MMVTVMSSPVAEKTGRMIRMLNGTGGARIMGGRCGNHCPLVPLNGGGVGFRVVAVWIVVAWGHVAKSGFPPRTGEETSEVLQL